MSGLQESGAGEKDKGQIKLKETLLNGEYIF